MGEDIDFNHPPVIEVICGVAFTSLRALQLPHIGLFWTAFKDQFPRVQELPPLPPPFGGELEIELSNIPPLPRIWFLSKDQTALIQIQKDRFIYNWKRQEQTDPYPKYENIYPKFVEWLSKFSSFLEDNEIGELQCRQYELTYVNHILLSEFAGKLARGTDILVDHRREDSRKRFLPEATSFNWTTEYTLPDESTRLYLNAQAARTIGDPQPLMRLDISVRGIGQDRSLAAMQRWFDVAHEWIVRGFVDATEQQIQYEVWGRM